MDSDFVRVSIENISLFNYNFMVLLKPEDDDKVLPICIGHAEAHSIAAAYNNHKFPRPLTHDLMKNVLAELDCTLSKIQVTEIKDGTFYARVFLETKDGKKFDIDSRTSDAIALALRYKAPVFVHKDVFEGNLVDISDTKGPRGGGKSKPLDPIEELKEKLDKAISDERYEEAAKLRDELQKLQGN
jgi:bifunctional DNase/RNase